MKETFYPEVASGGFTRYDGTVQFYQRINALVRPGMTLLDFGAGRGRSADEPANYRQVLTTFRGRVGKVIGVDVDPIVKENPLLDEAFVIKPGSPLPIASESVDIIISDFVFEHIEHPGKVCSELDRVLKSGGWLCARTPNRYGYIALGNRLIPESLKDRALRRLQPDRLTKDVFEAHYRLNTTSAVKACFPNYKHIIYGWDAEPGYGSSKLAFRLFRALHGITPARLKTTLMIFLQKQARSAAPNRVSTASVR